MNRQNNSSIKYSEISLNEMLCYEYKLHVVKTFKSAVGHVEIDSPVYMFRHKEVTLRYIKKRPVTHKTIEVTFRDSLFRGYDQF